MASVLAARMSSLLYPRPPSTDPRWCGTSVDLRGGKLVPLNDMFCHSDPMDLTTCDAQSLSRETSPDPATTRHHRQAPTWAHAYFFFVGEYNLRQYSNHFPVPVTIVRVKAVTVTHLGPLEESPVFSPGTGRR